MTTQLPALMEWIFSIEKNSSNDQIEVIGAAPP